MPPEPSSRQVLYGEIVAVREDAGGNLRLFRRGRLFIRQSVFHPAGEWRAVKLTAGGDATVTLAAGGDVFPIARAHAARA